MKIEIDIPAQRIADLMVTALECNDMTAAWCAGVHLIEPARHTLKDSPWYSDPALYKQPFKIEVKEVINECAPWEGDNIKTHVVTQAEFASAMTLWAKGDYAHHLADFIAENEDAVTADVFLQLVALKEVVYG